MLLLVAGETDYLLLVLEGGALRARINLGAGEFELSAPPRLRLDDLLWHEVYLVRKTSDITLTIDGIHVTRQTLAGRFHELNIHQGIFVGGLGDFNDLFLGLLENFRGCIEKMIYNGMDVFSEVQKRAESAEVYGIVWSCVDEFDAPKDIPISLVQEGAYIAFDRRLNRTGGAVTFDVKTQSSNSLLLYSSGPPSESDFVAMEIVEGKLRLVLDQGNGAVHLNSSLVVNDGKWHHIESRFSPSHMELGMDDHIESRSTLEAANKFLDLSGYLFLGGLEVNRRARAMRQGMVNGDKSLAGCVKELKVNERSLGIRDPRVTQGIGADCRWAYPCLKNPCVDGAFCIQEGTDNFRCECDLPLCVRQDFTTGYSVFTKTTLPVEMEVLNLTPVEVLEGNQVLITANNLNMAFDYHKFGIRESGVVFHVIEEPRRGILELSLRNSLQKAVFTLLDVTDDRVAYTHDGSESKEDSVVLELDLITQPGYILPSYLQKRHRFVLPIIIKPVNDPPSIVLPIGRVLRLPEGTKTLLTSSIFNATDPDSPPRTLRYSVLNMKDGMIESLHHLGQPANSFTQEDINFGLISYKHEGNPDTQIIFKVSDGISDTLNMVLRVAAFELKVFLINNTGLHIAHKTWALITTANLSCNTNFLDKSLDIRYQITDPPRYGSVQKLRSNNRWQIVNHFTSRQIERNKIRYEHSTKKPEVDEFRFKIFAGEKEFRTEYAFRISFVALSVKILNNAVLLIDQIQESFISESFLRSITKPSQACPELIVYTMVSTPHYGSVFLSSGDLVHQNMLRASSNFTQEDIAKGRIKYKLRHKTYSEFHDTFEFIVSSKGQSTEVQSFNIRYKPPPLEALVRVKDIDVEEGGRHRITEKYLKIETKGLHKLTYNISSPPTNGFLIVNKGMSSKAPGKNVEQFTSDQVFAGLVSYQHDGSETTEDNFYFVAFSSEPDIDFQYVGLMNINIILKNDNPPVRILEKVLNVVTNGERMITSKELMYVDPDINTPPYKIIYSRRKISNGEFFHVNERARPIYSFTQDDINKRTILFHHDGPIYSKAHITVSDGQLSTTGTLEIVASDPFVEVFNNSGIVIPRSSFSKITSHNLSVETNLNAWGNSVLYKITQGPFHGVMKVKGKSGVNHFTEFDLENDEVEYVNNGDPEAQDEFRFKASIGEIATDGIFEVKIFPKSYWEPLLVVSNISAEVEEDSEYILGSSIFNVMHPNIAASHIIYEVTQPPKQGYLRLQRKNKSPEPVGQEGDYEEGIDGLATHLDYDEFGIMVEEGNGFGGYSYKYEDFTFTQEMVNNGEVLYIHTSSNVTLDYFIFDVTNGITRVNGLYFYLQIIPKTVYVTAGTIKVEEGSKAVLTSSLITILSPYYRDRLDALLVSDQPQKGLLQRTSRPGVRLAGFTLAELEKGLIQYVHDGSEGNKDGFSLVAVADNKRSAPVKVLVLVQSVNDQLPVVMQNEKIIVWEGETVPLSKDILEVFDEDTPPSEIVYKIWSPDCGFLARSHNLSHPITKFTQQDINNKKIFFIHTDKLKGRIQWEVTDGSHESEIQFTSIQAKPLHLRIIRNNPIYVFPLTQSKITAQNLLIRTNADDLEKSLVYHVRTPPTLGRLLLTDSNGVLHSTNNFTQRNLNDSRVVYEHVKSMHELSNNDFFAFEVETPFAEPLVGQTFDIRITVSGEDGGELGKYLKLMPMQIIEGGSSTLSPSNLNLTAVAEFLAKYSGTRSSYLFAKILEPPHNGELLLKDYVLKERDQFRSTDIERGFISYRHNGGDSTFDEVDMSIYLVSSAHSVPDVLLFRGSLNISITGINDQPFKLVTRNPGIVVVRGQKAILTKENLLTVDKDNLPSEIIYEVMSGPDIGTLVHIDNQTIPLQVFTQQNINNKQIIYQHDGSNSSSNFYFQVSDGAHKPLYTVFSIRLQLLKINLINHTTITLKQASTVAYIRPHNIGTTTNGNIEAVFYNISRPPRYGAIYVDDHPVHTFSQASVNRGEVIYVQEDLGATGDSFNVIVWIYDQIIDNIELRVIVRPLLESKPLSAVVGGRTKITLEHLNASKLALSTDSMPIYRISRLPRLGRIKKISRKSRRAGRSYQVNEFTHDDIRSEKIYYVARKIRLRPGEPLHDTLHYILLAPAPDVQPAQGTLTITLLSTLMEDAAEGRQLLPGITPEEKSPAAPSRPHPEVRNTSINKDYFLLAFIVAGIFLIIILIGVAVRCSSSRRKNSKNSNNDHLEADSENRMDVDVASLPPPICTDSRPNSFMTDDFSEADGPPTSPLNTSPRPSQLLPQTPSNGVTLSAHLTDSEASWPREISREVSPSVPQCKVTPLLPEGPYHSPCQSPSQPPPSIAGYPYGADADQVEEWSMYETQPLRTTNPMLRKNQYWV